MRKRKKRLIILLSSLVALIALAISIIPFGNTYAEKLIQREIQNIDSLSLDSFSVSIVDRRISFYKLDYEANNHSISVNVDLIELNGISLTELILEKRIVINSLQVSKPKIVYQPSDSSLTKKPNTKKYIDIHSVLIKKLLINDGHANMLKDSVPINTISGIQFTLEELLIENINQFNLNSISYNDFQFHSDSTSLFQNENHLLKTQQVDINKKNGIRLEHVRFYPNEEYRSGDKKGKYRVNWTTATIDSLKLRIDWTDLFTNNKLISNQLQLFHLDYYSLLDKNYPRKDFKEKPMLNQLLKSIDFPIIIDSVQLSNSKFQYEERKEGGTDLGKVYFTNFNASISNISNDSLHLVENPKLLAKVESKLMDASSLSVEILYDLSSKTGNHQISGSIKDFDLRELNEVFFPLALVKFDSGHLSNLTFSYYLNNSEAEGKLDFYYEDLKVIIFKDKHIFKPELLGKLETTLANSMLIRSNNPQHGKFIEGEVQFKREKEKSFLTFWWKSLFSGMESTIMRQK